MDPSSPHHHHRRAAIRAVPSWIITVSDTRTPDTDTSGQRIQALLRDAGHRIVSYQILPDEPPRITAALDAAPAEVEVIILNGGTGIAARDTTYEAVCGRLDKELTGFGELFRTLSFQQIGAKAMLSRATAGVSGRHVVFSVPGSTAAVELAMSQLILPVLGHVAALVRK